MADEEIIKEYKQRRKEGLSNVMMITCHKCTKKEETKKRINRSDVIVLCGSCGHLYYKAVQVQ